MFKINFDYLLAMRQAAAIETIAGEMRSLANRDLQNTSDALRGSWTGEAADKFLVYCDEVKAQIIQKVEELNTTAATIRSVAMEIKRAEERANARIGGQ